MTRTSLLFQPGPTRTRLTSREEVLRVLKSQPVILAPMEDISDTVFRRLCRNLGATITVTEFVNVEGLLRGCRNARRKVTLAEDDHQTAIQIYGSDPERLAEAAEVAEEADPFFIDINCGCWVPKIAGRGAGAGWLRNPTAMVEMAKQVVERVKRPVTVKTRIGYGPESEMPIVELAKRLEDVGVTALTVHCRTAQMGHSGAADWSWAKKAQANTTFPVIVNGDVKSFESAKQALEETSACGVMVGRRAIEHPWVFREIAQGFRGEPVVLPSVRDRFELCREHLYANVLQRGEPGGVRVTRRHLAGYLHGMPGAAALRQQLMQHDSLEACIEVLNATERNIEERAQFRADAAITANA